MLNVMLTLFDSLEKSRNYNTSRSNMQENSLLHVQLSLQVALLKMLKYFEVMLNIFEFSRV